MYQDIKRIKSVIAKTKIDGYFDDEIKQIIALSGMQRETAIRQLLRMGIHSWHDKHSCNVKPAQQDFLNEQIMA
jgi:hypothetical protein